jgi:NTP pyrophosphatase (non-canonical NTP hydrolase)
MNLQQFQDRAAETDRIDVSKPRGSLAYFFGTLGELGSFLSEIKKSARDGELYTGYQNNLSEELGDMLWYIARLASTHKVQLHGLNGGHTSESRNSASDDAHLFKLASAVNELVRGLRAQSAKPKALFDAVIGAVVTVCDAEGLKLQDVLARNIEKNRDTWRTGSPDPAPQFDAWFPEHEQLPRQLIVEFIEISRGTSTEVIQRIKGIAVGDRLTDNAYDPDGYRYHDAFHLAYAASLGWSPVVRRMLRVKRKSDGRIDEVQDGARAAIIEEAIASLVFNYAREHSWLKGLDRVDHGLLKHIRQMVRNLEVADCLAWEWQHAILSGFAVFRELREHHGGWVTLDASTRALRYFKTPP